MQLVAARAAGPVGRVGYVIGSKNLKRAIDRNRLKRMLREAIRARRPALHAFDVVLRLRRRCTSTEVVVAAAEGSSLLDQLIVGPRP